MRLCEGVNRLELFVSTVAGDASFVPFLQSARTDDIVIAVSHDDAARM